MKQRIGRTKKYAVIGVCISATGMALFVALLNHKSASQLSAIAGLEAAINVLLLVLLGVFIRCLILLFQTRTLLAAGEAGLYLRVSRNNRGIVPWRNIAGFACSPDGRTVLIALQGAWNVLDGCGEHFTLQAVAGGKRVIALPLSRRVRDPERVCHELEEWREIYSGCGRAGLPDMDEAAVRRRAAVKKLGLELILPALYVLRARFWILTLGGALLLAALLEARTALSRPAVLAAAGLPALLASRLLRSLLAKTISVLERQKTRHQERAAGF